MNDIDVKKYINYMIKQNEKEKFKFYRLLEEGSEQDIKNFVNIIYNYICEIIKKKAIDPNNIFLIGILRSGSFLSHALKIISLNHNEKITDNDKTTYFFVTYPYLSILPRKLTIQQNNIYFFIDEAIKTGYSLNLASKYLKRTIMLKDKTIDLEKINILSYSVVNFQNYQEKREIGININYNLANLTIINNSHEQNFNIELLNYSYKPTDFNWENTISSYKECINKEKNKEVFKKEIIETSKNFIKGKERLDLVKAISNSENLFKICMHFVNDIINIDDLEKKTLIFYPGSAEGKLITDVIAFILKIILKDEVPQLFLNGKLISKTDKEPYLILTDLSYITGRTAENTYKLDVHSSFNKEKFDKIYVIYNKEKQDNNIFSIFNNNDLQKKPN